MELLDGLYLVGSGEAGVSDMYDCHVYLLDCGDAALIVDAGAGRDQERIIANIEQCMPLGKVMAVLLTHTHADHSGGTPAFQTRGLRVLAPEGEMRVMRERPEEVLDAFNRAKRATSYPPGYEYPFINPDGVIRDGEALTVGDARVTAMHCGGHSEGHLCYCVERRGKRILFAGDLVFAGGRIGLLNCPGSDLAAYRRDIGRMAGLAIDALLPGHRMPVLAGGQRHIDMAIDALSLATVPAAF